MKVQQLVFLLALPFLGGAAGATVDTKSNGERGVGPEPESHARSSFRPVRITSAQWLGRDHYRVRTRAAIYYYDPVAGGFSSILDPDGHDWVQYRDRPWGEYPASAASSFRGVPNLVFGGENDGLGHPGHRKATSTVEGNAITSTSLDSTWQWRWTFDRRGAHLIILRCPEDRPYWFLYEGPAGGKYRPKTTWWVTDTTDPDYTLHDHYRGEAHRANHRYFIFGEDTNPYALYLIHLTPDSLADHYSMLGNEESGALASPKGMVVAGFGRAAGAKPLLRGKHEFYLGFHPVTSSELVAPVRSRINRTIAAFND